MSSPEELFMRRLLRALLLCGLLAGGAALRAPAGNAQAPDPAKGDAAKGDAAKGARVHFNSVDGVALQGTFYASDKKNAPAVMIVHAIGEDSRRKEYTTLAQTLQKEGYSVLTFDLRGHGQSGTVDSAEFWSPKYQNYKGVAGAASRKDTIEVRDISKGYYSVFVNDLAAAKAFLDRKNDAGECNTASLIVIGSESGATLGAIWMNSEWYRYKLVPPPIGVGLPQPDLRNPEGKHNICGVWLSITPDLGTRKVPLASLLNLAGKQRKVPMVFLYSTGDAKDKANATFLEKFIKGKDKKSAAGYEFTAAVPVNAGPKLTGRELLKPTLGTDKAIVPYLQQVVEAKGNEWSQLDFRRSQYAWRIANRMVSAKAMADPAIHFSLYSEFIPR
jgi:pimeloyl-ACP methyl ester carboxylesterase